MYTEILSSGVSSIGIIALANYISSPSSTGSDYCMPQLMRNTAPNTQTSVDEEDSTAFGHSHQTIWLKKPFMRYRPLPKIK